MPAVSEPAVVIGAGPAGLTAAHRLTADGRPVVVLEADPEYVGGISRTVRYKDVRFDIGGHRFFSKSPEIETFWREMLGDDLLVRSRESRIFYRRRFFQYPLRPGDALRKLGPIEALRCVSSYCLARVAPARPVVSFQDWVTNEFGHRLFEIFFKTYTEKVWGMDCRDVSADWAAQRIQGLSLGSAIVDAVRPARQRGNGPIKTLTRTFLYPRLGPGMMWDACAAAVRRQGGQIRLGRRVTECRCDDEGTWHVTHVGTDGSEETTTGRHVISSAPLRELVAALRPAIDPETLDAASKLRYRDFLIVALLARGGTPLTDQWIYVHDPDVRVGRVQNFRAWSEDMVPDPSLASYGLEYFCSEGDDIWTRSDEQARALAASELAHIGLAAPDDIVDACIIRQPKAYPIYDDAYRAQLERIRATLQERFPTLQVIGRNGMHRYNNQDHAMMTAMLAAENIREGRIRYDVWRVNNDAEYVEGPGAIADDGGRQVPERLPLAARTRQQT